MITKLRHYSNRLLVLGLFMRPVTLWYNDREQYQQAAALLLKAQTWKTRYGRDHNGDVFTAYFNPAHSSVFWRF